MEGCLLLINCHIITFSEPTVSEQESTGESLVEQDQTEEATVEELDRTRISAGEKIIIL